uniref:Transmembrane protein 220 n=1 Tax=Nelumbo nucifera TaxID=4432 RepID=A0A822XND7_NELNU|nr:TPA_asm: hypothetical protein HUJ06_023240 [Nelumbo nucifera]
MPRQAPNSGKKMGRPARLFASCSLLLASLFAYSASVQLDDPDWYLWLPLYACASVVNLVRATFKSKTISRRIAKFAFCLGVSLLLKVVMEAYLHGLAGFWSLDLRKRVVREKMGSFFVVISMFLQLEALSIQKKDPLPADKMVVPTHVDFGMAILVAVSCVLSFVFFVFVKEDMEL